LYQHGRHDKVLRSELEVLRPHDLDVLEVLPRERRHGDLEDIQILLSDQVQKEVERPLEGLEHDLQRIWRDIEIDRQVDNPLAIDLRHHAFASPIASRTSRIVSSASRRAFSQPSATIFFTSVGSSR